MSRNCVIASALLFVAILGTSACKRSGFDFQSVRREGDDSAQFAPAQIQGKEYVQGPFKVLETDNGWMVGLTDRHTAYPLFVPRPEKGEAAAKRRDIPTDIQPLPILRKLHGKDDGLGTWELEHGWITISSRSGQKYFYLKSKALQTAPRANPFKW
ncbi:MAG: hypothetical protein FWF99_03720 [Desulfovibrionaceae bacterium]|nr:hypothetical protein [Desulfovibrionaceae bacterium]